MISMRTREKGQEQLRRLFGVPSTVYASKFLIFETTIFFQYRTLKGPYFANKNRRENRKFTIMQMEVLKKHSNTLKHTAKFLI